MKTRVSDSLKNYGFTGTVEEFRKALAEAKAEHFPAWSIDELIFTRDKAAEYCRAVKGKLAAPRLTRRFILRALTGLRKNGARA